jgi:hypothetical protein
MRRSCILATQSSPVFYKKNCHSRSKLRVSGLIRKTTYVRAVSKTLDSIGTTPFARTAKPPQPATSACFERSFFLFHFCPTKLHRSRPQHASPINVNLPPTPTSHCHHFQLQIPTTNHRRSPPPPWSTHLLLPTPRLRLAEHLCPSIVSLILGIESFVEPPAVVGESQNVCLHLPE